MSFNPKNYAGDKDQKLVKTPYGKGLITKTRPQKDPNIPPVQEIRLLEWEDAKSNQIKSKRSTILYSTSDYDSVTAKRGDDVITPYGRGTITESVSVRLLNKGKTDPVTKEPIGEQVMTKYHIQLNLWRLAGRSRVKCFLFSNQVKVLRKKVLFEMNAVERVEFAMKQKRAASEIFGQKKYREALNVYSGCIDAVRYIQHDTDSNNECRADLIEVMVTCSNNAATCCVQLQMWEEAFKFAKNALILLNAMFGKRGAKIHTILNRDNGHCDAKIFGEWRVKSRLIMARSLFEKDGHDLALEELRMARKHIAYYIAGEGTTKEGGKDYALSKASVSKMRIQEKEIAKLKAKITEKKKELLKFEKARAKAMFAEKPKDKVDPSTLNGKSRDKIENNNSESIEDAEKKEKDASVDSDNTAGQSKRMQKRVSFASNLEERHEIVEEEEEDDPWYEEHKEAFILLAIGGLAFASVFARTRRS